MADAARTPPKEAIRTVIAYLDKLPEDTRDRVVKAVFEEFGQPVDADAFDRYFPKVTRGYTDLQRSLLRILFDQLIAGNEDGLPDSKVVAQLRRNHEQPDVNALEAFADEAEAARSSPARASSSAKQFKQRKAHRTERQLERASLRKLIHDVKRKLSKEGGWGIVRYGRGSGSLIALRKRK